MKKQTEMKVKGKALRLTTLPWLGEVQRARSRVVMARSRWAGTRLGQSALNVEVQAHAHPLTCVGVAAGAGLVLGWFISPGPAMKAASRLSRQAWPWIARLVAMTRDTDDDEQA